MRIFKFITKATIILKANPFLGYRHIVCKCRIKIPSKKQFSVIKKIGKIRFDLRSRILDTSVEYRKELFFGCYELPVVRILMTVLKKGDTFIDVGANIGYISAIAMDLVGPQGQVHAFEPVKQYFRELKKLKILNKNYQLYLNNVAVGKSDGQHKMHCTKPPFLGGSTIVNGFLPKETPQETQVVKIMRLDTYIRKNNIKKIKLIKIDVEGYEYSVLQGFVDQLFLLKKKPIIICEISPSAYVKIDYSLKQLKKYMSDHGYVAKSILNPKVIIDIENLKDTQDVLFMSNSHN